MKRHTLVLSLVVIAGCSKNPPTGETNTTSNTTNPTPRNAEPADSAKTTSVTVPAGSPAAGTTEARPMTTPIAKYTSGLSTPESIVYDEAMDRYLVSNINGKATDVDNNGYISVLSPDGKTTDKWIEGGKRGVTLNAPKGVGLRNGMLVVADIDTVRMFDLKSGAPKGEVKIAGATFLNDVAVSADGRIFVSDSGLKASPAGDVEPTKTDAIYAIDASNKVKTLAKDPSLGRPNGLWAGKDGVWAVTYGGNELYRLDNAGKKHDTTVLPKGGLDGIVMIGETFYVSSWDAAAIYRGRAGGTFDMVIADVRAPADIGLDSKRSRLLVPRLQDNEVDVFNVQP